MFKRFVNINPISEKINMDVVLSVHKYGIILRILSESSRVTQKISAFLIEYLEIQVFLIESAVKLRNRNT